MRPDPKSPVSPVAGELSLPAPWQHQDIGPASVPGTATCSGNEFTVQGTMDIWGKADGCQLVWQLLVGDVELVARVVAMDNPGGVDHAKASLSIRESLAADSRQVTMCVTPADGTQFLYRDQTGGATVRIFADPATSQASVPKGQFPCWLKLVRRGEECSGYESVDGRNWQFAGRVKLELAAGAVIGLASSSHRTDVLGTATFDHVQLAPPPARKRLSQLVTMGIDGTDLRVVYETADHIEAPNWSPDGKWLVFNSKGSLWRLPAGGGVPERIATGDITGINNDHVISADGRTIYFSANGHLYAIPFGGGTPRRISNDHPAERQFKYYLHGVSPDDSTLAYAGVEAAGDNAWARVNLFTIPTSGGADTRLTDHPAPDDGPEYSPDGKHIYFNSELNATIPGHAQCYRMAADGSAVEQLTFDERVNWFPHISPDGQWIVYISFPPGTLKHPANKDVILRRLRPDGSEQADLLAFNGGQGTINVNSWAPDSQHFAFVMYPDAPDIQSPPRVIGLSHVAIQVSDMAKALEFYSGLLGFAEQFRLNHKDGSLMLVALKVSDEQWIELFTGRPSGEVDLHQIAFRVEDGEALRAYLGEHGVKVPPQLNKAQIGNLGFTARDPQGYTIEFVQYMAEGWIVRDRGKYLPEGRISRRITHAGVKVADLTAANAFYGGLLGFRESWRGSSDGKVISWLHLKEPASGDYVEFMLTSKVAPHFCLDVPDMEQARLLLEQSPVRVHYAKPIEIMVGKNRRRIISLFDPDGNRVELMEPTTVDGVPTPPSTAPLPSSR